MKRNMIPAVFPPQILPTISLLGLLALLVPPIAFAQGVLVVTSGEHVVRLPRPHHWPPHPPHPPHPPRPPRPEPPEIQYAIEALTVDGHLHDQVAEVQVSQKFKNTGKRTLEASFVFPLPYDGAIDQMTLLVNGKEMPARLLDAKEAREEYESIVRRNRDPALLEWIGTGMFRTSVFPIPAGETRTVTLRYTQLLRMQDGVTDFLFPMSTARYTSKPIEKLEIRLSLRTEDPIKNIYSPTHAVKIKRPEEEKADITLTEKDIIPENDFRLLYDLGKGNVSSRLLSYRPDPEKDGYFLLLAAPKMKTDRKKPVEKTVLFVLDRSGSMSGDKIEQAREALKFVLNNLEEGDLFNIIAYDSEIEEFAPELQRYNKKNRKKAIAYCEGIRAGGSTNINEALLRAMKLVETQKRPTYVLFLTDGLPTSGERNETAIVENIENANDVRARVFPFGVGYDVNSRLLDKIARKNFGQTEYVRPDEDIEERVSRLYHRISSPVLTDVELAVEMKNESTGSPINRVYPKGPFDLFAGEQLVMVGRYDAHGKATIRLEGTLRDEVEKHEFPARLVGESETSRFAFIERLWAQRRIGEILDQLDLKGENEELIDELVRLSTRHGILTPYTSFLADENTDLDEVAENARRTRGNLRALEMESGYGGFAQRNFKSSLQRMGQAGSKMQTEALSVADSINTTPARPGGAAGGMGRGGGGGAAPGGQMDYSFQVVPPSSSRTPRANASPSGAEEKSKKQDARELAGNVRNIADRAFYLRKGQWVDATLTESQKEKPIEVKQFSDEYFDLIEEGGRELAQYLVFDEPVLLRIEDQAYLVKP